MTSEICVDSPDAAATARFGEQLGALLEPGDVIALNGPLGAGKTCFTQGIARALGVPSDTPVTSPTFTLVGEYPARIPLRHADFYRVESESRLLDAGFDDLLDGRGVLVVEWALRWPNALPPDHLEVEIEPRDTARRLVFRAHGPRSHALLGVMNRAAGLTSATS